ncbi:unnamed protein product, partial [Hapterophycus canaliculatus]
EQNPISLSLHILRDSLRRLRAVQAKLKKNGFDPGAINGQLTPKTCEAVKKYQRAKKLSEGPLTYEFLHHIGVNP